MKKKFLYLIAIAVLAGALALSLSACNRASTQGQLADILNDHNHEFFEYEIFDSRTEAVIGSYKVYLDSFKKGDVIRAFDDMTFIKNTNDHYAAGADGTLIRGELSATNEDGKAVTFSTGCYFTLVSSSTTYMLPACSYRVETVDGEKTLQTEGRYNGNVYDYTRFLGGEETNGSVKLSAGTYFDNNEFQQILRSVTTFASGLNLTFSTPLVSANEATSVSLSASMESSAALVHTPFSDSIEKYAQDGIACFQIAVSRSTQLSNQKHQTLYYANDYLLAPNPDYPTTFAVKNALMKIVEPYKASDGNFYVIEYNLKSASLS